MRKRKTASKAAKPEDATIDLAQLQLLPVPEVAKLLAIGCTKVYELINAQELQSLKIGKARRILVVSIWEYVERQKRVS